MDIEIVRERISLERVRAQAVATFGDMVKVVVDVRRGVCAMGGELHADAEALLLEDGSAQQDVWGANILMDAPVGQNVEYTSMINIRPSQGNRSRAIQDPGIREAVHTVLAHLGMV
jgi:hypothetical protein